MLVIQLTLCSQTLTCMCINFGIILAMMTTFVVMKVKSNHMSHLVTMKVMITWLILFHLTIRIMAMVSQARNKGVLL